MGTAKEDRIDPLTKVWGEMAAQEKIGECQNSCEPGVKDVFILLEVENFKEIQRLVGVDTGKVLLQQVAFILNRQKTGLDVLGRIGESVFLLYFFARKKEDITDRTEGLITAVENLYQNMQVRVGGAIRSGQQKADYDRQLACASGALVRAKETGQVCCIEPVTNDIKRWNKKRLEEIRKSLRESDIEGEGETQADVEFITELIFPLFLSENMKTGIEMALEQLCLYFHAEQASITEKSADGEGYRETYVWSKDPEQVQHDNLKEIPSPIMEKFFAFGKGKSIQSFNSIDELEKFDAIAAQRAYVQGTKAALYAYIRDNRECLGMIILRDKKGARFWSEREITTYQVACRIITACILKLQSMEYTNRIIYSDMLTKSWNLRKFQEEMAKRSRLEGTFEAVITFDIKNFKFLNTRHGYHKGNQVLIEISNILRLFIQEGEAFARREADTFVLLLRMRDMTELDERLPMLIKQIEYLSVKLDLDFEFVCMMGVCVLDDWYMDLEDAIAAADVARRSIKERHKSGYTYAKSDYNEIRKREQYIASSMHRALRQREFVMYYQPKVDVETGKYVSLEALVRWILPDGKRIMPGSFIPLFERNGFIVELDYYVLDSVCQEIKSWMDQGKKLYPVAVNFSRLHLEDSAFPDKVEQVCKKYGVPTNIIEVELTESAFIENQAAILEMAQRLKEKGFQLSMDDFGTGYSSLSMLKDVPVDIIKLDRTFLREEMTDREKIVVSNIIHMAMELGILVVSEGIETQDQIDYLREVKCKLAQGFYFARPEPIEKHAKYLWGKT